MRRIYLIFFGLLLSSSFLFGQFFTLDFETAAGYTTSVVEFTDGSGDYFLRTDGSDISGVYNGPIGTYFFAAQDIDGEGATLPVFLDIDDIDISDQTNIEFRIYLAEDDDGTNQDWDGPDYFHIGYDIDNTGTFTPLLWVESELTGTNGIPRIDTDFDGVGDGTEITDTFVQFSANIAGSGSLLDIQMEFDMDAGDEDIALDMVQLFAAGGNSLPVISNVTQTPNEDITSSTTVSISADVTDSDGTITLVELHWGLVSGSLGNTITMGNGGSGDSYTTNTDIPAQADGATVYWEIYAEDDVPEGSSIGEYNYTVSDPATTILPYSETFDADLGDCYTRSVSGDTKFWVHNGDWAQMNGFNSGELETDWLILPGINFNNYPDIIMSFDTWWRFGTDDVDNYLKFYYSTDYPGLGDPTGYTWTEISFTQPDTEQTWTSSGMIDLSAISGSMVYLGFKYNYAVEYRWWEIDNIEILDQPLPVILSSFTASLIQNEFVSITWVTQSESNMSYYRLWRDGFDLVQILASNTSMETTYEYIDEEIIEDETYHYELEAVHVDNESSIIAEATITIDFDEPETPEVPQTNKLYANYPNPFNPETTIRFNIKDGDQGKFSIYNARGQLLEQISYGTGFHEYVWDASKFGSGVYLYKLETNTYSEIKKMVMSK